MADAFMALPLTANLYECVNSTGMRDRNRLDGLTRFFGVAYRGNIVRTLHLRDAAEIAYWGGPLGFVNHKCSEVYP